MTLQENLSEARDNDTDSTYFHGFFPHYSVVAFLAIHNFPVVLVQSTVF